MGDAPQGIRSTASSAGLRAGHWLLIAIAMAVVAAGCSSTAEPGIGSEAVGLSPTGVRVADVAGAGAVYSGTTEERAGLSVEMVRYTGPGVDGLTVSTRGLRIDVEQPLDGLVEVRLALPAPPDDQSIPVALHITESGELMLEPGLWDPSSNEVVVLVNEFSDRFGGWWNPLNWGEEAIQLVQGAWDYAADFVTGRTDPPGCRNDGGWMSATTNEVSSLHVCVQSNQDGNGERSEILLKSNRRTMQLVTIPTGADFHWVEDDEWLTKTLAPFFGARDSVLLLRGGMSTSFGFRQPELTNDAWISSYQTPQIIVANGVLSLLGHVLIDKLLGVLAASFQCVTEIAGMDIAGADLTPDGIRDIARAVEVGVRCVIGILADAALSGSFVDLFVEEAGLSDDVARAFGDRAKAGLKKIQPTAKRLNNAFAALAVGAVVTDAWDSAFDNIAEGRITVRMEGHGGDAAAVGLGQWRPTCADAEDDWRQLYRNVGLRDEFSDTSRLWSEYENWSSAVAEAVRPFADCDPEYVEQLASYIVIDWAQLDPAGAAAVADALRRLDHGGDGSEQTIDGTTPPLCAFVAKAIAEHSIATDDNWIIFTGPELEAATGAYVALIWSPDGEHYAGPHFSQDGSLMYDDLIDVDLFLDLRQSDGLFWLPPATGGDSCNP